MTAINDKSWGHQNIGTDSPDSLTAAGVFLSRVKKMLNIGTLSLQK